MLRGRLFLKTTLLGIAVFISCILFQSNTIQAEDASNPPPMTSMSIVPISNSLALDQKISLSVKAYPENSKLPSSLKWSVDKKEVATINESTGVITTHGEGIANITVQTVDGTYKASTTVHVVAPSSDVTVDLYNSLQLKSNAGSTWSSTSSYIVRVSNQGLITGNVKGKATISVRNSAGSIRQTFKVAVLVPLQGMNFFVDEYTISLDSNDSQLWLIRPMYYPTNASNMSTLWTSSDPNVVSVDFNGRLNPHSTGKVTITARAVDGGYVSKATVNVVATLPSYLPNDFTKFITHIEPYVTNVKAEGSKMFTSVRIAQSILETGGKINFWNNIGGIKAHDLNMPNPWWTGLAVVKKTWEEINGKAISIYSNFRAYESIYVYYKDQDRLFLQSRYTGVRNSKTAEEQAQALVDAGYATDSKYATKLQSLMSDYSLNRYDLVPKTVYSIANREWYRHTFTILTSDAPLYTYDGAKWTLTSLRARAGTTWIVLDSKLYETDALKDENDNYVFLKVLNGDYTGWVRTDLGVFNETITPYESEDPVTVTPEPTPNPTPNPVVTEPKPKPTPKPTTKPHQTITKTVVVKYTVKRRDTLSGIASKFQISLQEIVAYNKGIRTTTKVKIGQKLIIKKKLHKVARGETIKSLAKKYKTSEKHIVKMNSGMKTTTRLKVGQYVRVN